MLYSIWQMMQKFGYLKNISAFSFENFMQVLKKDVRNGHKVLQQFINRYGERRALKFKHLENKDSKIEGPLKTLCENKNKLLIPGTSNPQYLGWKMTNFNFKMNTSDNCVKLRNGEIVLIENIATSMSTNEIVIIGRSYEKLEDLFLIPCKSSLVNIFKCSLLDLLNYWPINHIEEKLIRLTLDNEKYAIMPFINLSSF